jgi:hypothetical protein
MDVNSMYSEKTPAATLVLHWTITTIMVIVPVLIIQPQPYSATPAFSFLADVFAYIINVSLFTALAFGILCLRFSPKVRWAEKSEFKHPSVSIIAALILFVGCLFPVIFIWVPDPAFPKLSRSSNLVPWFAGQTAGVSIIAFSLLYWIGFRTYISVRSAREGKTLHVKREPKFKHDAEGLTQILEIVTLQWRREVGMRLDEIEETTDDGFRSGLESPASNGVVRQRYYAGERDRAGTGFGRDAAHESRQYQYPGRRQPEMYELPAQEHIEIAFNSK